MARALLQGRGPNYLIAFVTGHCNLSCEACCDAAKGVRESRDLSVQQWARALEGARSLVHLTITGGEPFVRRDLPELIPAMVRASGVPRLSIDTNGWFTERVLATVALVLRTLPRLSLTVFVSLDGPEEVHDRLRAQEGSFAAARRTLEGLAELRGTRPRFKLRICSVLQPGNEEALEAFLDETASWSIDHHELALVRDVPRSVQASLLEPYGRLTRRQLERASPRFRRGLDGRITRKLRQDVMDAVTLTGRGDPCPAGSQLVEILPDGTVVGCELAKMKGRSRLGNVTEQSLVDVLAGDAAQAFREAASTCRCSFECALSAQTVFQPRHWARLR